jgi:hypothetical protein
VEPVWRSDGFQPRTGQATTTRCRRRPATRQYRAGSSRQDWSIGSLPDVGAGAAGGIQKSRATVEHRLELVNPGLLPPVAGLLGDHHAGVREVISAGN